MKQYVELFRAIGESARSETSKGIYKDLGIHMYLMSRWTLAAILHPVTTFKAVMLVGTPEEIERNAQKAMALPKLHIGRERLHP